MFNRDYFGSYIIYAAWPQYQVFFDGGADIFGEKIIREYLDLSSAQAGSQKILDKYDITIVIINSGSQLSHFLIADSDWRLIYSDKVADILVKNTPEHQGLIAKYPFVKPFATYP